MLSDAPRTAIVDTSANPIISAAAVWAVRRGLRIEFSRPSRPGIPSSAASGRPSAPDSGRATIGTNIPTAANTRSAPIPTRATAGDARPSSTAATPATANTPPAITRRRRSDSGWSSLRSTSAATGAIRTARLAGTIADSTVTPTPTTIATTTVRASNTSGADGSTIPNAFSSALSPIAATTPRPRPISDAPIPSSAASPRTERNTCWRLAPTIRSSASSRVRWPTVIEKVLKIVKPPTNSAMPAKISSAVEMNDSSLSTALDSSLATLWPLTTCTPDGRSLAIASWSLTLSAPGAASTLIVS